MFKDNIPMGARIAFLSKLFKNSIKELCNEKGINSTYSQIIMHLSRKPEGVPQNNIAEHVHLAAPTISLTLKNMEYQGLIIREVDKKDSRKTIVKLTTKGYEMDEVIRNCFKELEEKMVINISLEDLNNFKRIIDMMKNNLIDEKETTCNV